MLGFAVGADARGAFLPYGHEVRVGLALLGGRRAGASSPPGVTSVAIMLGCARRLFM